MLQALTNGLLVDPHNQREISDALLRLVADRNLWSVCRKNGLRNIHLFSWPEHCRTYLSRVAMCRMRHPQWKTEVAGDGDEVESQGDSLRDVHDISLRLSVDGEKLGGISLSNPAEFERLIRSQNSLGNGKNNLGPDELKPLSGKQRTQSGRVEATPEESGADAKRFSSLTGGVVKTQMLKKRRRLVVIAVDGYDLESNKPSQAYVQMIQDIVKTIRGDSSIRVQPGLIISSALGVSEVVSLLTSSGLSPREFDALICSSGSEVYYPAGGFDEGSTDVDLNADADYKSHIDYRWGYDGLRKTMARLNIDSEKGDSKSEGILVEDADRCNSHCLAYHVNNADFVSTELLDIDFCCLFLGVVKLLHYLRVALEWKSNLNNPHD